LTLTIPLKLTSEANQREHWAAKHRRRKAQQAAVRAHLLAFAARPPPPPVVVTLTRLGGRRMDPDNLAGACKHVQDAIAKWLGLDDGSPLVLWRYAQAKAERKQRKVTKAGMRLSDVSELRVEVELWNEAQGVEAAS
jgi:predicted Fe-S protein YdhL (DUF1289 family)